MQKVLSAPPAPLPQQPWRKNSTTSHNIQFTTLPLLSCMFYFRSMASSYSTSLSSDWILYVIPNSLVPGQQVSPFVVRVCWASESPQMHYSHGTVLTSSRQRQGAACIHGNVFPPVPSGYKQRSSGRKANDTLCFPERYGIPQTLAPCWDHKAIISQLISAPSDRGKLLWNTSHFAGDFRTTYGGGQVH